MECFEAVEAYEAVEHWKGDFPEGEFRLRVWVLQEDER
jgi:hypothetical protein